MFVWISVFFYALGLVSAVHAVMSTRTATGATAWAISLVTLPYIAVPAYWVFGRSKFEGYVESRQENQEEIDDLIDEVRANLGGTNVRPEQPVPGYEALKSLTQMTASRGNHVELLVDGSATFDSIINGIAEATDYVLVEYYIVHDDGVGRRIKDALIERANAGVRVFFLYDEIGSKDLPRSYKDELRDAGIEVSAFNTTQGRRNQFQLNFRNHRKLVVVDGVSAWTGGLNVGDEYIGLDEKLSPWRDTHVRLEGPIALKAQAVFVSDWYWATRKLPELNWIPRVANDSDVIAMIVATGPADDFETAGMFFVHALNSAKKRIWITAPYFVPDEAVMKALELAALRGVDVRILVPGLTDSLTVQMASYHYIKALEKADIKFCAYHPGFMHQKVMLVDDEYATVGTPNFDNRSFRLNFEITALIYDEAFNNEVAEMLETDLEQCVPIDPNTFDDKSFFWRLGVNVARLMSPIL